MDPEETHKFSFRNRPLVEAAERVGCFSCLRSYAAKKVAEWVDEGRTAVCPYCGIDAVLPGEYSKADLAVMNKHWFTGIVVEHHPTTGDSK